MIITTKKVQVSGMLKDKEISKVVHYPGHKGKTEKEIISDVKMYMKLKYGKSDFEYTIL